MLLTFDEVSGLISKGTLLHAAGTESLLKKLPAGNWIGGSTEYFMSDKGGVVSGDKLFVTTFDDMEYKITSYTADTIQNIADEAFDNGFSIVIIPFESKIHEIYAQKADGFSGMFIKNIVGWISGINLNVEGQTPISVDGRNREASSENAVCLHFKVQDDKMVNIGIVNIFNQDKNTPVIEFETEGFFVKRCKIDGKEVLLADYIAENNIDTRLPLVGDYFGASINTSFKAIDDKDKTVSFYAPVFKGIQYRIAQSIDNYQKRFGELLPPVGDTSVMFSCNCILNFLYGELEGKHIDTYYGPITFGEIAYQLVNQTLVYVSVTK